MKRALSILMVVGLSGCGSLFNQHAQMMDAMRGVMSDTASRLSESGTGQVAAGGQVIHPGIQVSGGVEYYARAEYVGVAGQVTASMHGTLDRLIPPEVQERINAIWRDASLSDAEKTRLTYELLTTWLSKTGPAPAPADPKG